MPKPAEEAVIYLVSPDGTERRGFLESYVNEKQREGWTISAGQTVKAKTDYGEFYTTAEEFAGEKSRRDIRAGTLPEQSADYAYQQEAEKYSGLGNAIGAYAIGVPSGATLGFSDALLAGTGIVPREDIQGLREHQAGASLAGELTGIVASSLYAPGAAAADAGALAKLLAKTPAGMISAKAARIGEAVGGVKGMALAEGLEGAGYAIGQTVSNTVITDHPVTAESFSKDLIRDVGFGGLLGAAGGAVGGTIQKIARARKGLTFEGVPKIFEESTAEGAEFLGNAASAVRGMDEIGGDLLGSSGKARDIAKARGDLEYERRAFMQEMRNMYRVGEDWGAEAQRMLDNADVLSKSPIDLGDLSKHHKVLRQEADLIKAEMGAMQRPASNTVNLRAGETAIDMRFPSMAEEITNAGKGGKTISDRVKDAVDIKGLLSAEHAYRSAVASKSPAKIAKAIEEYEQALATAGAKVGRDSLGNVSAQMDRIGYKHPIMNVNISERADLFGSLQKAVKDLEDARMYSSRGIDGDKGVIRRLTQLGHFSDDGLAHAVVSRKHAEAIVEVGRLLNKDVRRIQDIVDVVEEFVPDMVRRNKLHPKIIPKGIDSKELVQAREAMRAALGMSDKGDIGKTVMARLFKADQKAQIEAFQAMDDYNRALAKAAKNSGSEKLVADQAARMEALAEAVYGHADKEVLQAISWKDLAAFGVLEASIPDLDGPLDNIAKFAISHKFMSKMAKSGGTRKASGILDQVLKAAARRGAGQAVYQKVGGNIGGAMVAGAASNMAGNAVGGIASKLRGAHDLAGAAVKATASIGESVASLLGKAGKVVSHGSVGAVAGLKSVKFGDEDDSKGSLQQIFKRKSDQLSRIMADPYLTQVMLNNALEPVRQAHDLVGDKVEMQLMRSLQFAYDKMPKDPRAAMTFGKSRWEPDELAIHKWSRYLHAMANPMSVVDGVVDGSITPQGAETLRTLYPDTFSKVQQAIFENADVLSEKLSYDQKIRVSILMDQPIDSVMEPKFRKFMMEYQVQSAEQQVQQGQTISNASKGMAKPEEPTKAQSLVTR